MVKRTYLRDAAGPRWRTAPGLGAESAAVADDTPHAPWGDEGSGQRPAPRRSPVFARGVDGARRPPGGAVDAAGDGERVAGHGGGAPEDPDRLYTHDAPRLRPGRRSPGPGADLGGAGSGVRSGQAAESQSDPAAGSGPELARPQIRMDADLPRDARAGMLSHPADGAGRETRPRAVRGLPGAQVLSRSVRSVEPISDAEAAAFAGRFAADFQSFDEDDPSRRAEVLRPLLADPQAGTWGWSGVGRQRADSPLPGRSYRSADTVVFVEITVRVTGYARACPLPDPVARPALEESDQALVGPSSAPPETDPRWVAGPAHWVRMTVPITRDPGDGRLVVDPHLVPDAATAAAE